MKEKIFFEQSNNTIILRLTNDENTLLKFKFIGRIFFLYANYFFN